MEEDDLFVKLRFLEVFSIHYFEEATKISLCGTIDDALFERGPGPGNGLVEMLSYILCQCLKLGRSRDKTMSWERSKLSIALPDDVFIPPANELLVVPGLQGFTEIGSRPPYSRRC
jgi:hypothetical protein